MNAREKRAYVTQEHWKTGIYSTVTASLILQGLFMVGVKTPSPFAKGLIGLAFISGVFYGHQKAAKEIGLWENKSPGLNK